jgi:carbon-monoxide dehydrogenase medium subunit
MKPAPFEYVRPNSLFEAVSALSEPEWGARVLAGGQSLVPMLNLRLSPVTRLVDISKLDDVRGAQETRNVITFGACVRHGEFEDGEVPDPANGMMRYVSRRIAYRAIRNRGTIGGSVSLADPSADWVPVLIALNASFRIVGPAGERTVGSDNMVVGPYTTSLGEHDILVGISVPKLSPAARWGSYKIARKAGEYPITTAAAVIDPARGVRKIVLGAANRGPLVLTRTSTILDSHTRWSNDLESALGAAIRADLAAADRGQDFYETQLCITTVLRAVAMATVQ